MNWLLTIVLCALLVELVLRLPFLNPIKVLSWSSNRALRVITTKGVSDHWKEKAMGAYAQKTFIASGKIAALLAVVLGFATLLVLGLERLFGGFQAFILSWKGLGSSIVAATLYIMARRVVFRG